MNKNMTLCCLVSFTLILSYLFFWADFSFLFNNDSKENVNKIKQVNQVKQEQANEQVKQETQTDEQVEQDNQESQTDEQAEQDNQETQKQANNQEEQEQTDEQVEQDNQEEQADEQEEQANEQEEQANEQEEQEETDKQVEQDNQEEQADEQKEQEQAVNQVKQEKIVMNLKKLHKKLEWFKKEKWFFPYPEKYVFIKLKDWSIIVQWIIWERISKRLWYDKKIVDSFYWKPFIYSISFDRKKFAIMNSVFQYTWDVDILSNEKWFIHERDDLIKIRKNLKTIDLNEVDEKFISWMIKEKYEKLKKEK